MKYRHGAILAFLLVRESGRALVAPFRLLLYLPRRRWWRARAAAVLHGAGTPPERIDRLAPGLPLRGHAFVSAGETSGETHAARVLAAVTAAGGVTRWSCFGGPRLQDAGARLLHPLSDRAVMGIAGVFSSLPFILRAVARFLEMLDTDRPDVVLLVDYPGLHLVLADLARRRGIPVIHYIAPQYWAWGPWRMRRYRRSVDATLTILPFEPAFFRAAGIPCEYVGHPLLDATTSTAQDDAPSRPPQPQPQQQPPQPAPPPTLCLLPGSRRKEILLNLPGMLSVAAALRRSEPGMEVVLPHVDSRQAATIQALLAAHRADFVAFRPGPIGPTLQHARLVLAKSGTGSLEACLHGVPTVVVYRLGRAIEQLFVRYGLSVPWIASANLIAGREVIPEFCFSGAEGWTAVEAAAARLWNDGPLRDRCRADLDEVRRRLGAPGASARVARWILPFCSASSSPSGSTSAP